MMRIQAIVIESSCISQADLVRFFRIITMVTEDDYICGWQAPNTKNLYTSLSTGGHGFRSATSKRSLTQT